MKIGIDISQIVYQTGVSRYTTELVENLLKLDQENQYVLYAGSLRQGSILKAFVAKLPLKPKFVLTALSPQLADIAFNRFHLPLDRCLGQVDVFHASNWAIPKLNCPIVTTIHDLTFLKYPENLLPHAVAVHRRHLKRAKTKAAGIITVSQSTKKDLIEQGVQPDKIHVVYEAASSIFKPVKTASVRDKYQLKAPFIFGVGTQEPRKNLGRLVEAFKSLADKNLELLIAGKFGWGEAIKPIAGVKLLGFVPDEDLVGLYSLAKVFVYPSLYEGFGLPVLEAMACGCPVVTSNVSSLPELAGKAAIYVDPLSVKSISLGIKTALTRSELLRQAGLDQAQQFSWSKTARETLKIYAEVYENRY